MDLDILIFAAHPDDAELSMGGTIAKLTGSNLKVGIIDLTEAELSTRGTIETRKKETEEASKILNLLFRENLKFPDGKIKENENFVEEIICRIRKHQPKIVFAPYFNDRHPDHIGTSKIVKEAVFFSGLEKIETKIGGESQAIHRPKNLYYYMQTYEFTPSFIVDISAQFETKMNAVRAYKTQFYDPESNEPNTFISDPKFIKYLEARAQFYGFQIRKDYGEPFFCEEAIELELTNMIAK